MKSRSSLQKGKLYWGLIFLGISLLFLLLIFKESKLVRQEQIQSWTTTAKAECAVVLTGGPNRVREGFDLLSRKQVRTLIISGVHSSVELRDIMPVWIFYPNLIENDIVLERRSNTTFGNAQQSAVLAEALRCHSILLVTSVRHMSRAFRTFRAAFPDEIEIKKHSVMGGRNEMDFFETWTEIFKSFFYSLWAF